MTDLNDYMSRIRASNPELMKYWPGAKPEVIKPEEIQQVHVTDVTKMNDIDLAFEYRECKESGQCGARFNELEQETAKRVMAKGPPKEEQVATSIKRGCIPCMPPDSMIWSNPGSVKIKHIYEGQKVIDGDGKLTRVLKIMKREYEGDLISIKVLGQNTPVLLTPEHPVLAIEAIKCKKEADRPLCFPKENIMCRDCGRTYRKMPKWVNAGELTAKVTRIKWHGKRGRLDGAPRNFSRHILLMPRFTEEEDVESVNLSTIANIEMPYVRINVKDTILVNRDFMKLLGYYLAEGSVNFGKRGALIRFDFGSTETDLVQDTIELFDRVFGVRAKAMPEASTLRVWVSSMLLGKFLVNLVGTGSHVKHIPYWILKLPVDKQIALLDGYWKGDGYEGLSYGREVMSASTVSPQLAFAIRLLLHRLGILHSLSKQKTRRSVIKGREIKSGGDQYVFRLNTNACTKLKGLFKESSNYHFVQSSQFGMDDRWVYMPVTKVSRIPYKGPVFNIETESQNYCTNGIIVHNCSTGHLTTCAGLLNEAMRFVRTEGVGSDQVLEDTNGCLMELNALERIDMSPEKIAQLPPWEKELALEVLALSKETRYGLEGMRTPEDLERVTDNLQPRQREILKKWFRHKIGSMTPQDQRKIVEEAHAKVKKEEGEHA